MKEILEQWNNFLMSMGTSSSTTHKIEIMTQYKDNEIIKKLLSAIHNDFIKYYITNKAVAKTTLDQSKINPFANYSDIFELLDDLSNRKITGHQALHTSMFYAKQWGCEDLLIKILSHDSNLRISSTSINKAIPNLLPVWNVQLGESYDPEAKDAPDFDNEEWLASRKLDGVRGGVGIDNNGEIFTKSREGLDFETLQVLHDELQILVDKGVKGIFFDGEVCIIDENGDEDFQSIMKEIGKGSKEKGIVHTIQNPRFMVFDMISYDDFITEIGDIEYDARLDTLNIMLNGAWKDDLQHFKVLEQIPIKSLAHFLELQAKAKELNWEGWFIRRKKAKYKGKRNKDQYKVKKFEDIDLFITGYEIGPFQVVVNGESKTIQTLTKVIVDFDGYEVKVGSGFTLEERERYANDPSLIMNKEMTTQFFEITKPKTGGKSLRFPTKKFIYENGRRNV